MNILVTGGYGYIGSNFIRHIRETNKDIRIHPLSSNIDIADFNELHDMLSQLPNPDIVIHCAALMSTPMCDAAERYAIDVNVKGTYNVASLAKKMKAKFVYIGSTSSYLPTNEIITEESKIVPETLYGLTKYMGEQVTENIFKGDALIIRLCHVYGGENDWYSAINKIISEDRNHRPSIIFIKPHAIRDWMHIEDCVNMMREAIVDNDLKGVYNISAGKPRPFKAILSILSSYHIHPKIYWKNEDDYMYHHVVSNQKLLSVIKYRTKWRLETGIEQMLISKGILVNKASINKSNKKPVHSTLKKRGKKSS